MEASLSSSKSSLTSASTLSGSGVAMAAPFSNVRLDIMKSAAGTPLPETSAMAMP